MSARLARRSVGRRRDGRCARRAAAEAGCQAAHGLAESTHPTAHVQEDTMSWNGHPVIDLDSHIVERADRFYRDYLDAAYHESYQQLCDAVARQAKAGDGYSLFGSRTSIIEPIEAGRPLGRRDTVGLTRRSSMEGGRPAFSPRRTDAPPPIRPEVDWDAAKRVEDLDLARVDVSVLYPPHVSSYCALRDVGFENALYRAYHRWVAAFCGEAPSRLKWTVVANMRDVPTGVAEVKYWAER